MMKMTKTPSQKTTESIESEDGFPVHAESKVLSQQMSQKVVRYATKRLEKSAIDDYVKTDDLAVPKIEHSDLDLGSCLGQGSFSSAFEITAIRHTLRSEYKADRLVVKVLQPKLSSNPPMLAACAADLVKEGMIMASLQHHNILGVKAWSPKGVNAYSNGRHDAFFLVLERLEITLGDRLTKWQSQKKGFKFSILSSNRKAKKAALLKEQLSVILQLSEAVRFLHTKRILHRDLKPDNIGFDKEGVLKVFDFDVARVVPEGDSPDTTFKMTKRIGSPRYMSPECARGEGYNCKADVYTFALLAHQLLTLEKPYDDVPSRQHDDFVFFAGVRPLISSSWPQEFSSFLRKCWSNDVKTRPTMEEAHEQIGQALPLLLQKYEKTNDRNHQSRFLMTKPKCTTTSVAVPCSS